MVQSWFNHNTNAIHLFVVGSLSLSLSLSLAHPQNAFHSSAKVAEFAELDLEGKDADAIKEALEPFDGYVSHVDSIFFLHCQYINI